MTTKHRVTATLFCLLLVGPGLTACGGDDNNTSSQSGATSSPTGSPTPAVCQDLTDLQTSVEKMKQAKIGENALPVLSTELTKMQTVLKRLPSDASAQYQTETDAVQAAADALESSIKAASDSPSAATLAAVGTDIKALGTSISNLGDALANTC